MQRTPPYRIYWIIWSFLLVLTLLMVVVEGARFPRAAAVLFLVTAMLLKAGFIGGWFMHLRYERLALVISVAGGTLLTAAFLYFLLVPDGMAMLRLAAR